MAKVDGARRFAADRSDKKLIFRFLRFIKLPISQSKTELHRFTRLKCYSTVKYSCIRTT